MSAGLEWSGRVCGRRVLKHSGTSHTLPAGVWVSLAHDGGVLGLSWFKGAAYGRVPVSMEIVTGRDTAEKVLAFLMGTGTGVEVLDLTREDVRR